MWMELFCGLEMIFWFDMVFVMVVGLVFGIFVGFLFGFIIVMVMVVLLLIFFFLDFLVGIFFLIGVYKGGIYGGFILVILIGVFGIGVLVVIMFDGFVFIKKGKLKKVFEMVFYVLVFGDIVFSILMIFLIGLIVLIVM